MLEEVVEAQRTIDGIEGKGYTAKIAGEDAVQSPLQVEIDGQVLVGFELAARLNAPVEFAQVVGKIVGGSRHFCLLARGVLVADVGIGAYLHAVFVENVLGAKTILNDEQRFTIPVVKVYQRNS